MFLFLFACVESDSYTDRWSDIRDADQDGYSVEEGDCNDSDPSVHPEAEEICDQIDNNCDGNIDLDAIDAQIWGWDQDLDGVAGEEMIEACEAETIQMVQIFEDCNDQDPRISPLMEENWNNAFVDNDCSGSLEDINFELTVDNIEELPVEQLLNVLSLDGMTVFSKAIFDGQTWMFSGVDTTILGPEKGQATGKAILFNDLLLIEVIERSGHVLQAYSEAELLRIEHIDAPSISISLKDFWIKRCF